MSSHWILNVEAAHHGFCRGSTSSAPDFASHTIISLPSRMLNRRAQTTLEHPTKQLPRLKQPLLFPKRLSSSSISPSLPYFYYLFSYAVWYFPSCLPVNPRLATRLSILNTFPLNHHPWQSLRNPTGKRATTQRSLTSLSVSQ